ncbi:ABC transporter-like protein [Novosphingobium sp. MBES04]|nr:ABC transporter-like protein [Novosphingobium sp. MBES04]
MKRLTMTRRTSWALLFVSILLSNTLALTMPLVARQVLSLGGRNPHTSSIFVLVLMVMGTALLESAIKYCRAIILGRADRAFMIHRLHWLLDRTARAQRLSFASAAATSVDYAQALHQVKGIASREVDLIWAEISFVPVIVAILFLLSPLASLAVLVFMGALCVQTYHSTRRFSQTAEASRHAVEQRFVRLFSILERMHLVKALAVEQHMTRVYEQAHGAAMRDNLRLTMASTHLTHSTVIAGMMLNLLLLMTCAIAARGGHMDISLVISIVLLAARLTDPIQRAVFTYVQGRDRQAAFTKIKRLDEATLALSEGAPPPRFEGLHSLEVHGLPLFSQDARPVSLTLHKGDFLAISSPFPNLSRQLMRAMAGLEDSHGERFHPQDGAPVTVNGHAIALYSTAQRNRILGYVAANSTLFDGTIQDNITRFGEVSIDEAFAMAELLGMVRRLNELPGGLQTRVGSDARTTVPPGLERQIAILRALVHKPAIILFDHAEQGLDREAYAALVRFFGKVHGHATIVLASEDANLTSLADTGYSLERHGLCKERNLAQQSIPYRAMTL